MMTPKAAREIGNKIGVVEDVEQRRQTDDQKLFLRVRVALTVSKPLRRGGFLMGSDGKRHWVDYKYERLSVFCHFCGVLGQYIRHCPAHFEASKKLNIIEYQYGEWLKASSGRNRSPPRQRNATPHGEEWVGKEDNRDMVSSWTEAAVKTAARDLENDDLQPSQYGNNGRCGIDVNHEANVLEEVSHGSPHVDSHVPRSVISVEADTNLNVVIDNGLKEISKEVGLADIRPKRKIAKWTRQNRMEVGLNDLSDPNSMFTLGKWSVEAVMELENTTEAETLSQKRTKVGCNNGVSDFTSAGVEDHPCREQ